VFFIAFDELVEMGLNSTNDVARGVIDGLKGIRNVKTKAMMMIKKATKRE
jgi:hypothetical protein